MKEKEGLSLPKNAYGGVSGDDYVPVIKDRKSFRETTFFAIFVGIILAILFAGSNAYLGLTAGMTIAGGIPGAIIATALLMVFLRRKSILEANLMQSMTSGGESIASGVIFVLPAIIILGGTISFLDASIAALGGMFISAAVMVLTRRYLVVKSHSELLYPESIATSEVLVTSNSEGKSGIKDLLAGAGVGAAIKILSSSTLGFFNGAPKYVFSGAFNAQLGILVSPALIGVGYIIGAEVGLALASGTLLANFAFVPVIKLFGGLVPTAIMFPASIPISEMSPGQITSVYTRYIGAGAIATGGLITIIKTIPTIVSSIKQTLGNVSLSKEQPSEDQDLSLKMLLAFAAVAFIALMFLPSNLLIGFAGTLIVLICVFLFAIVAARMTGIIGTSNLPVSGMTIASFLLLTPVFVLLGYTDEVAVSAIIMLGTAIVTGIAYAGGFTQSLKTTFLIGGSAKSVERGIIIAGVVAVFVVIGIIILLDKAYGFTTEGTILVAPQANLMSLIVTGVVDRELPWALILSGVAIAIALALLKLPVMSIAIGFYLPVYTVMAVLAGGIMRGIVDNRFKKDKLLLEEKTTKGIVLSAGLVAGETIVGLFIAFVAISVSDFNSVTSFGSRVLGEAFATSSLVGAFVMAALIGIVFYIIFKRSSDK